MNRGRVTDDEKRAVLTAHARSRSACPVIPPDSRPRQVKVLVHGTIVCRSSDVVFVRVDNIGRPGVIQVNENDVEGL